MKKTIRYFSFFLFAIILLFNVWILLTGKSYFYDALRYNFAGIDDYKLFPQRVIKKGNFSKSWISVEEKNRKKISDSLRSELALIETIALLIIKDDTIQYEEYWEGYGADSYSNSFSVAKSFVSTMIGIALQEGAIKSIDQPVADFLPEFSVGRKKEVTIKHLLTMSSGLNWEEGYASPLSPTTEAYYGKDLKGLMAKLDVEETPGTRFKYKSGDTQILSFVLEKATGKKLATYLQEKLWAPLGCEQNAIWSLDKEGGDEKAYCCLNSNARDFARLGKLYLDSGKVNGEQILPLSYVLASVNPHYLPDGDLDEKPSDFYGYQWWTIPNYRGQKIFYARGILGQYIIVIPELKTIVVRLGKQRGVEVGKHYKETYSLIDEVLNRR